MIGPTSVYLAAPVKTAKRLRRIASFISHSAGVTFTSSWVWDDSVGYEENSPSQMGLMAVKDLQEVSRADVLVQICFPGSSGGMYSELGIALALHKRVIVVGPRSSCFQFHPCVVNVPIVPLEEACDGTLANSISEELLRNHPKKIAYH